MGRLAIVIVGVILVGAAAMVFYGARRQRQPATPSGADLAAKKVTVPVEGMSCASCAASVRKTLKSIDGVTAVEVDLEHRRTRVQYAAEKVSPERIAAAINQLGYKAGEPKVEAGQ